MSKFFTRLMVMEAMADDQIPVILRAISDHNQTIAGLALVDSRMMAEDGGRMIIFETAWIGQDRLIQYHASRGARQLIAKISHMLVGEPVIKMLETDVLSSRPKDPEYEVMLIPDEGDAITMAGTFYHPDTALKMGLTFAGWELARQSVEIVVIDRATRESVRNEFKQARPV